jgi:hypothetical protein
MKKILIPICLIASMAVISCKKEEKEKKTTSSTWALDGTTYTGTSSTKNDSAYSFYTASAGANISFFFKDYPTSSGTYRINDNITLEADEVNILFGTLSPLMVGGPTTTSAKVTVTVTDGKINIKCSDVPVEKEDGSGGSLGTATLSADVYTNL